MSSPIRTATALTLVSTLGLAACAGGGSSDTVAQPDSTNVAGVGTTLNLYAYAVPKVAFDRLIPAFQQTSAGKGVEFQQSYGASGDQCRKVAAGAEADVVNFSVEPDVTRLVDAGLVEAGWNADEHRGIPFGSVVTIVVRKGNPKGITDWDDLLQPGVEVVTPNPFSSGFRQVEPARPLRGQERGRDQLDAGLAYVSRLVGEHVRIQPKSGREATEAFLQGSGDALLSYENEALFIEANGDPVEHVTPPHTFKIENPVAVLKDSQNRAAADAFNEYLYTAGAQKLLAEAGFRPVTRPWLLSSQRSTRRPPSSGRSPTWVGGSTVDAALFKKDVGEIAKIYDAATQ